MFVVHVVRQFYPGVGGLENHVLDLARAQVAAGDKVRVVTLDRLFTDETRGQLPGAETVDDIEVVRIPYFGSQRYPIGFSVLRHLDGADIVHVHAIDFFYDFLAWTKPLHRHTLVATTHGGFFHTRFAAPLKRIWFSTVTRLSSAFYAAVIACSVSDFERFRTICPKRVHLIEDGIDTAKFYDASSKTFRKSILAIGRFSENKRFDLLLCFARALKARDPEWRLTIAGRPDYLQIGDMEALIDKLGLKDTVELAVSPSDAELKQLMSKHSFLASASEYEGFGMTAIEGMSAGLYPLLSGIPPFKRLVDRTSRGLILDYANPDAAAEELLRQTDEIAQNYGALRAACMHEADANDWTHIAAKIGELYKTVLGTNGSEIRATAATPSLTETTSRRQTSLGKH